jgi:hypothetical protein
MTDAPETTAMREAPEPCDDCGSTTWIASLVFDDGTRLCADCLLGRAALRRAGAAVPPAVKAGGSLS